MDDIKEELSDPHCLVSDTSSSSSSAHEAPRSRGRPRKRKSNEDLSHSHSRIKRFKHSYNDKYRQLFNETVNEIGWKNKSSSEDFESNQIGATIWSPTEKPALFQSLAKHGKRNIRSIAADIGSKSEPEIQVYLEILQKASTDEQLYASPKELPRRDQIDTAFEISQECCENLDQAADALIGLQQREEDKHERNSHSDYAVLTLSTAKRIDRQLRTDEGSEGQIAKEFPAAHFLNLKNFFTLSKRFFMNSSVPEDNWRTYSEGRKNQVSIMYTAFSDLHNLAISITKRLVQSCLFFAMSRLRALDASGTERHGRHVRRLDVRAALRVLGMESNARSTWVKMARKCRLRVYEEVRHRKVQGKRLSYDEIEAILSSGRSTARGRSPARSTDNVDNSPSPSAGNEGDYTSEPSQSSESSTPKDFEDSASSHSSDNDIISFDGTRKQARKQEALEEANDAYTEALDQSVSRKEEQRLWRILGKDPNQQTMHGERLVLPHKSETERQTKEELVDWTAYVDYAPEWEMFDTPVSPGGFPKHQIGGATEDGVAVGNLSESGVEDEAPPFRRNRSKGRKSLSDKYVRDESSSEDNASDVEDHDDEDSSGEDQVGENRPLQVHEELGMYAAKDSENSEEDGDDEDVYSQTSERLELIGIRQETSVNREGDTHDESSQEGQDPSSDEKTFSGEGEDESRAIEDEDEDEDVETPKISERIDFRRQRGT